MQGIEDAAALGKLLQDTGYRQERTARLQRDDIGDVERRLVAWNFLRNTRACTVAIALELYPEQRKNDLLKEYTVQDEMPADTQDYVWPYEIIEEATKRKLKLVSLDRPFCKTETRREGKKIRHIHSWYTSTLQATVRSLVLVIRMYSSSSQAPSRLDTRKLYIGYTAQILAAYKQHIVKRFGTPCFVPDTVHPSAPVERLPSLQQDVYRCSNLVNCPAHSWPQDEPLRVC